MTKSIPHAEISSLRRLTVEGEQAMAQAHAQGGMIIDAHSSEVIRSYVASGLLMAALDELQTGIAREHAAEMLREALSTIGAMPS